MTSVRAADMHPQDTWHYRPEFDLHVAHVEVHDRSTAVLVREYPFLLHLPSERLCDVEVAP